MSLELLFSTVSQLAMYILPVLGVILLIYLIIFVKNLIDTLKDLSLTLLTAESEIKKLDGPLNTANELSKTVDEVHHATKAAVTKASKVVSENFEVVKDWVMNKNSSSDSVQTEDKEDVVVSKEEKSDE